MTAQLRTLSFSDTLKLINGFELKSMRSVVGTLCLSMDALAASYAKKPEKEQAYLANRFAKAARKGSIHQRLLALSVWQNITAQYGPLPAISKSLRQEPLDPNASVHAFNGLIATAFDGAASFSPWQRAKLDRHCRRVYDAILARLKETFAGSLDPLEAMVAKDKRIALCTTQFLGRRHAPTAQILSMAKTLCAMGYSVKIFNQALIPRRSTSGFYFPFAAPKFDKLNAVQALDLGDEYRAGFWQNPSNDVTQQAFDGFVSAITAFAPEAMITLGPGNLYADLVGHVIANTSMPTTIDLAIGAPGAYGTVQPLTPLREALYKPLGITAKDVVALPASFMQPLTDGPIDRAEFGITPDDYAVAIVTNRAASEITESFWQSLTQVLEDRPHMTVRIFGSQYALAPWQKTQFKAHRQIRFMGYADDLFGALSGFDAMLNPPRLGGGTSAAHAMALGLNLFTLEDCDVAVVAGDAFVYPSLTQMLQALKAAANNPAKKSDIARQAKARWDVISDQDIVMRKLLKGARKAQI